MLKSLDNKNSDMEKESALKTLPFWNNLSQIEKTQIVQNSQIQSFRKDQVLHGSGANCLGAIVVLDGELRSSIVSEEGREITLFRLYKGDSCVLSASCVINVITFDATLSAQTDSRLLVIGPSYFSKLADENVYVRCFMYEKLAQRFSNVMFSMQQILFKGYDKRLAQFLTSEYDRTKNPDICYTHEQIAALTGSAREVVARMLKRFSQEKLVSLKRGCVTLLDLPALKRLGS